MPSVPDQHFGGSFGATLGSAEVLFAVNRFRNWSSSVNCDSCTQHAPNRRRGAFFSRARSASDSTWAACPFASYRWWPTRGERPTYISRAIDKWGVFGVVLAKFPCAQRSLASGVPAPTGMWFLALSSTGKGTQRLPLRVPFSWEKSWPEPLLTRAWRE